MSIEKSEKLLKMEEAALHDLGENLVIFGDQLQERAAESHQSVGAYLKLSSSSDEFFLLHSVEDGRLTGVYHYLGVPLFRTDGRTPAEVSEALIGFVRGLYHLRRDLSNESVFDEVTYDLVTNDLMMGFMQSMIDED